MTLHLPPRVVIPTKAKHWTPPPGMVRVTAETLYGNPFAGGGLLTHAEAVEAFRDLMTGGVFTGGHWAKVNAAAKHAGLSARTVFLGLKSVKLSIQADMPALFDKPLGCTCLSSEPCHADVLLELANRSKMAQLKRDNP